MAKSIKRKYTSVSVDGSSNQTMHKDAEKDLFKRKAIKQLEEKRRLIEQDSQLQDNSVIVDKRTEESEQLLKQFLKLPPDHKFTYDFVIRKFLELVMNYMHLNSVYEKTANELMLMKRGITSSLQDAAPSWN